MSKYQKEKAREGMRKLRTQQKGQTPQRLDITPDITSPLLPSVTPKPVEGWVRRDQKWGLEHGPDNPCGLPECIICHPEAYEEYKQRRDL